MNHAIPILVDHDSIRKPVGHVIVSRRGLEVKLSRDFAMTESEILKTFGNASITIIKRGPSDYPREEKITDFVIDHFSFESIRGYPDFGAITIPGKETPKDSNPYFEAEEVSRRMTEDLMNRGRKGYFTDRFKINSKTIIDLRTATDLESGDFALLDLNDFLRGVSVKRIKSNIREKTPFFRFFHYTHDITQRAKRLLFKRFKGE